MKTQKVLIADADEIYRRHLRDYLMEKDDFSVFDVGNGEMAVKVAVNSLPSVVLLDIMLPDMSGIEVCRKLKSDGQLKFVPVIIHTARIGLTDRLSAFIVGAHKYLPKPCRLDDIYDCLQVALRSYDNKPQSTTAEMDRMRRM